MPERRTQEQRRTEARSALTHAATELVGRHGYASATLAKIGEASGVSRGLVNYHFGTKINIVQAVVADLRESTIAFLEEGIDELRGLRAIDHLIDRYLAVYKRNDARSRAFFVTITEALTSAPELSQPLVEHNQIFRAMFVDRFEEAKVDGEMAVEVDSDMLSFLVVGVLRGAALQFLLDPGIVDLDAVVTATQRLIAASVTQEPATAD